MKKLIIATLILVIFLSPSHASFQHVNVTAREIKPPKKVQDAYMAEIERLTSWLFSQYRALVIASGESVSKTRGGNYLITFDLFDIELIIEHQVLSMEIRPNGEIVRNCEVQLP
jgi:hypothetical protein